MNDALLYLSSEHIMDDNTLLNNLPILEELKVENDSATQYLVLEEALNYSLDYY